MATFRFNNLKLGLNTILIILCYSIFIAVVFIYPNPIKEDTLVIPMGAFFAIVGSFILAYRFARD